MTTIPTFFLLAVLHGLHYAPLMIVVDSSSEPTVQYKTNYLAETPTGIKFITLDGEYKELNGWVEDVYVPRKEKR